MCVKALTGILASATNALGLTSPESYRPPAEKQATDHEGNASVKIADGSTAYDRTSGGARVGGGGRKKAKSSNVPGLGL